MSLEKARLQAEAMAAEEARRKAEQEAAAEAKKKRELEREAARQALQMVRPRDLVILRIAEIPLLRYRKPLFLFRRWYSSRIQANQNLSINLRLGAIIKYRNTSMYGIFVECPQVTCEIP